MKSDWFWLTGLHRQHCNEFNIEICTIKNKWRNWGISVDHWEDLGLSFRIISSMKLGLLADCVEALKIREIRLVFVNKAPKTTL